MKYPSILVPVIAGFGVILLLLLSVTVIGVTHISLVSERLTSIVSERNQKAEFAATMHGLHESRFQSLLLAASQPDPFMRDEEIMHFSRMARDFILVRDRFLALPLDDEEHRLWNNVRDEVRQVEEKTTAIMELIQADALEQARLKIKQDLSVHQKRMMAGWDQLLDLQRAKNQIALSEAGIARERARNLSITLSAVAMLVGVIITVFVVRLSRRMEKDLFEEKERAQVTLRAIGDGVIRFNDALRISYLNPMAENMLGITAREARDKLLKEILNLFDKQDRSDLTLPLAVDVMRGNHVELPATANLISAQGMEYEVEGKCSPIHSPDGEIEGGVLVIRDVTEAREMQRKLVWQADHDGLTGIMNRRAFEERVTRALNSKRASEYPLSLLFIDLDHFKQVNDSAGHAAGDELLKQLGKLMQSRIRENDVLARLGGDEFAIMLTACPNDMAEKIATVVRDSVANLNFVWESATYQVGASIGVVHVPPQWATLDECMAAADAACYKAKHNGRNEIVVHGQ
jgi:diguanylate cyclase (GGDEF)-like protein/PAS domain S-box-containing protein